MADEAVAVRITGLTELGRAMNRAEKGSGKHVRLALNVAADSVKKKAAPLVPYRSGRARNSLRVASTRSLARVRAGSKAVPYYPWLDFGGRVGRNRSISRPFLRRGRFLYPTYDKLRASGEFERVLEDALADMAREAGLELTRG